MISRRNFLQAGLIGGGALAMASTNTQAAPLAPQSGKDGFIDAHVHVWTPDVERYPLASGFRKEEMKPASFTPQELFSHARPVGVERIVLIQMSFYGFDNSYMLEAMREHPGVFSGVAVIDSDDKPRETMLRLAKQGVRGFRIQPGKQRSNEWLGDKASETMWKCGAEHRLAMCPLIDAEFLPAVDRMCTKLPETPVVIDHMARIGVDGQFRQAEIDNLCRLAQHPNVNVKVSAFYALGKRKAPYLDMAPLIRQLHGAYGAQRLMWASDGPFQVVDGHNYRDSIELVRKHLDFLSDDDRQWMLRKTAERVYFA